MTSIQRVQTPPAASEQESRSTDHRTLLHPASGALILGLDWLLWTGTVASGGLGAAISGAIGFAAGGAGTALIQRRVGKDTFRAAILKGVAAGIVVGAPFPIAGTAVGATVLTLSGLDRLLKRRRVNPEL